MAGLTLVVLAKFWEEGLCKVKTWTPPETFSKFAWNFHKVGKLPNHGAIRRGSTTVHTIEFGSIAATLPSSVVESRLIDEATLEQSIGMEN